MRPTFSYWILGLSLLFVAAPVFSHHSFMKEFDMTKPITLKATVTKVDWSNPHINFWADVKDEKGVVTNWAFQSASPTALARGGWARETLKAGDQITIEGFRSRDGKPYATTRFVTLPDGRKMQANADGVPR